MVALVCFPEPWTVVDGTANAAATGPLTEMALDNPACVYRSTGVTTAFTVLSACPTPIDLIAIVGTNLRCRDYVRIRVGSSQAEVDGTAPVDYSMAAWSGLKTDIKAAMTVLRLPVPVMGKYVRVDIVASGHPDGYVQISRLVIGSACESEGVGTGSEISVNDASTPLTIAGMSYFDRFPLGQTFKASVPYVSDKSLRQKWHPLFSKAGITRAVLFVPQYELKAGNNLLRESQTFYASWSNTAGGSWVRNADYAHDGAMNAAIISDNVTDSASYFAQSVTIPSDVVTYTGSVHVKKTTAPTPMVRMLIEVTGVAAANTFVQLNPRTGESNYPAGVTDEGDYWRISRPITNTTANTIVRIRLYPAINAPDSSLTSAINEVIGSNTFSGAQIHIGSEPLEWTPSSFEAVTDNAYPFMEQNDAVFGFIAKSTSKLNAYDWCSVDLTVTSVVL